MSREVELLHLAAWVTARLAGVTRQTVYDMLSAAGFEALPPGEWRER